MTTLFNYRGSLCDPFVGDFPLLYSGNDFYYISQSFVAPYSGISDIFLIFFNVCYLEKCEPTELFCFLFLFVYACILLIIFCLS